LPSTALEEAKVAKEDEHRLKEELFGATSQQALAKFTQNGAIEAWVRQLQTQSVLPIYACTHSISGLLI
jgi:hypothetical protein